MSHFRRRRRRDARRVTLGRFRFGLCSHSAIGDADRSHLGVAIGSTFVARAQRSSLTWLKTAVSTPIPSSGFLACADSVFDYGLKHEGR